MTEVRMKVLVDQTGLPEKTVRYRLNALGITGREITPRLFLYPDSATEAVKNYVSKKEQQSVAKDMGSVPSDDSNNSNSG